MLKFYLRQTTPFTFSDLPLLFKQFFVNDKDINKKLKVEIAKITEKKHIVLSNSMRSVLLKSLEFFRSEMPDKSEILLPEYSFHSNLSCATKAGFTTKFVPVDQKTLFIDENKLEKFITKKTLGIIITHLHGEIYDLNKIKKLIKKYNLIIFEDCAHSFPLDGYFSLQSKKTDKNSVKCLSFGAGKFVTAFGGGALATNNKSLFNFVESSLVEKERILDDLIVLVKACLYTIITQPFISYLTMKPALALIYLFNKRKNEADLFDKSKNKPKFIDGLSNFQQGILLIQLTKLRAKVKAIILKRKRVSKEWSKLLINKKFNPDFCFQIPILADGIDDFIWKMWKQNIDVQQDYCTYLPKLIKDKSFSKEKFDLFEKIVYLPTNQYLSTKKIKETVV